MMVSADFGLIMAKEYARVALERWKWLRRTDTTEKFDKTDASALECIVLEGELDISLECHAHYELRLFSDGSYRFSADWMASANLPTYFHHLDPGAKVHLVKLGEIEAIERATKRFETAFGGKIVRSRRAHSENIAAGQIASPQAFSSIDPVNLMYRVSDTLNTLADAYALAEVDSFIHASRR
jgi:hypothetical protein